LHRACRDPPDPSRFSSARKATQIINRLFRSFSDSYFWSIITILIIVAMIFSATVFPAIGSSMNRISLEYKGKTTPVIEIKAVFPQGWGTRYYPTFLNNQTIEGSWDPWVGYWRSCFNESDVNMIKRLGGVETIVRVLDYEAWYRPEVLTPEMIAYTRARLEYYTSINNSFLDRESYRKRAASWNMTPTEYFTMTSSYTKMIVMCIDTSASKDWSLGFGEALTEISEEDLNSSIVVSQFILQDDLSPLKVGQKALFLIGQEGEYSPGSPIWSTEMELNGTTVSYDKRHVYEFNVTSSFTSGSTWNGKTPGIIADLDTFLHILEKERNPDGAPLPIYTSLLVKPTSPTDYAKVEGYLRGLYPGKTVSRAGTAPLSIDEKAAQASTEFYSMAYLYTSVSAGLGVAVLFVEAVRNRKMLWLLRSRGWTRLDILSYSLAKAALLGIASGVLAALTIEATKPLIIDSLAPQALMNASPTVVPLVLRALNESMSGYMIFVLPILGVTAAVLCSVASTIYNLMTKPKGNLYDATSISVNRP